MKSDSINFMYTTLIENSLTNLTTEEFENGADGASLTYKNDAGEEKTVPVIKSPFVFSFNKDATDEDGISAPITAYSEKADTPSLLAQFHLSRRERQDITEGRCC